MCVFPPYIKIMRVSRFMEMLKEIKDYCLLKKPAGALLIKGEWGCGKTYFIDHTLTDYLKDQAHIIRISLFGLTSILDLHQNVKSAWLDKAGGFAQHAPKLNYLTKLLKNFHDAIPDKPLSGIIGGALSIDFTQFVKIQSTIDEKPVTLVFDDLERSKLSTTEIMGAINEYSENNGFHVIIVTDEEKLMHHFNAENMANSQLVKGEISFQEIKEKVVMRTIHFEPDFGQIVRNVVADIVDEDYKRFLQSQEVSIRNLLVGKDDLSDNQEVQKIKLNDEAKSVIEVNTLKLKKKRPHNVRSLKAAIQDFNRVYMLLQEKKLSNIHLWLLSFIAFSMAARANLFEIEEYKKVPPNNLVELLYPGCFLSYYFPEPLMKWVLEGNWDEKIFMECLESKYAINLNDPVSLIKNYRLDHLDDSEVDNGIGTVIQEAYEGKLTYNQYVQLIRNSMYARDMEKELPDIDWRKIQAAIEKKIQSDINNPNNKEILSSSISERNLMDATEDERNTYQLIFELKGSDYIDLETNKRYFIQEIKDHFCEETLWAAQQRNYRSFDKEMALATLDGYKKTKKRMFLGLVQFLWGVCVRSDIGPEIVDENKEGLTTLLDGLRLLCEEYKDYPLKWSHTQYLVEHVEEILFNATDDNNDVDFEEEETENNDA